jgi:predicted neutral ceramidase superfamily lipid hydrolase
MDILENPYVKAILTMLILLYTASIRPDLPSFLKNLFTNPIFKVVVLFFVVMRAQKDPVFSLAVAVAFVTTLNLISQQQAKEAFKIVNNETNDSNE